MLGVVLLHTTAICHVYLCLLVNNLPPYPAPAFTQPVSPHHHCLSVKCGQVFSPLISPAWVLDGWGWFVLTSKALSREQKNRNVHMSMSPVHHYTKQDTSGICVTGGFNNMEFRKHCLWGVIENGFRIVKWRVLNAYHDSYSLHLQGSTFASVWMGND